MSQSKMDQTFPLCDFNKKLSEVVSVALRKDFGEKASSVKQIGQLTHANLRSIKNWYEARNVPSSTHLLLLAKSSPSIRKFILEYIGHCDVLDEGGDISHHQFGNKNISDIQLSSGGYIDRNNSANIAEPQENHRQIQDQEADYSKCCRSATFNLKNLKEAIIVSNELPSTDIKITSAEDFGTAIKILRKAVGNTQSGLAFATKTTRTFIVDLERGKPTCQLGKALAVLQHLEASLHMVRGTDSQSLL